MQCFDTETGNNILTQKNIDLKNIFDTFPLQISVYVPDTSQKQIVLSQFIVNAVENTDGVILKIMDHGIAEDIIELYKK